MGTTITRNQLKPWQKKLLANHKLFKRVFSTEDGKKVLAVLGTEFASYNLMGADDRETNFNLGQRSLVDYLELLAEAPDEVLERLNPTIQRGAE